ncbi:hypothetical protein [Actinoplanes utahensis]|uniref:Uncharacterized protein n=1 Tax=Actinoplanes utahensis TaxID=1869 RepID=A0A0A6UKM5_ACTUT|nr:hypothetical protein [Actinoplanes utahensis]KHD76675.1 hypothetical protein MB27_15400 [Actinoplanes utahensis]GIF33271.1 hypothetical protein Aut01nite_62570 [Actinoplanes utahensis]
MSATYGGLIAPDADRKIYEGAGIFESANGLAEGIVKRDWGGAAGNLVATGLGAIGAVTDPLQTVFSAGLGWLFEHVSFIREPFDRTLGNPKAIEGHAESWKKIEARIYEAADLLVAEADNTMKVWTAESANSYRRRVHDHALNLQAMGKIADGMGKLTYGLGALVGVVRNTIRDILCQFAGSLLSIGLQAVTGVMMPAALLKVADLAFSTSKQILTVVRRLFDAIREAGHAVKAMGFLMRRINKANDNVLRLFTHRSEAAEVMREGWLGPLKGTGKLFLGDFRVYGAPHQVLINTGRAAAESNTSQNTGSTIDNIPKGNPDPDPLDPPS